MIEHIFSKLQIILSSVWGWLSLAGMVMLNYFAGYEKSVGIAVVMVAMDAIWGIASSVKQGNFAKSELARDTIGKLSVYGCSIVAFIGIDKLLGINNGITTSVVCAIIVLVELWSTMASMLIIFPRMPFLKLLRKALVGEIANKLHVSEEDVLNVLKDMEVKR